MCGCLSHGPHCGPGPQPRHVPWLGIEPVTLWFAALAQSTELHQPGHTFILLKTPITFYSQKEVNKKKTGQETAGACNYLRKRYACSSLTPKYGRGHQRRISQNPLAVLAEQGKELQRQFHWILTVSKKGSTLPWKINYHQIEISVEGAAKKKTLNACLVH